MARLGDVCDILNGFAFKSEQYVGEGIRIIRIANVQKGYIEDSTPVFYPYDSKDAKKYSLVEGDMLMSLTGNVGRVAKLSKEFLPAALNQRVACLRIKNGVTLDKAFLFNLLNSDYFEQQCIAASKGVAQKNMSTEWLKEYEIPMFPLEQQIAIASVLDKVTELIAMRNEQLAKLDELIKSRFIELFGLPVSNTKKWNTEKMREIAPAENYSGDFDETVWLLNLDMVESQTGRIIDYLYVLENKVGGSTCTFDTSNVLYSKLRPYLNKVVIPDRCGYATSEMVPLKPNPVKIKRTYLAFMLRSDEFVNMINEKVAGAKMPRVSMSDFREFAVPVPPMELQEQFEIFVEQTEKSKLAIQQNLDKLELLKKSLMQEYFG